MTTVFISSAILIGVVLLFGCIGETLTEKAGHLNLGIPGIMCAGTAGGVLGVKIYMMNASSPVGIWCVLISIFFSALFAGLFGLLYAVLTVTLRANQNVTGLAITIFGNGFASFFLDTVVQTNNTDVSSKLTYAGQNFFIELFPFADKLGWFGEIFLSHGFLTYFAIIIAICCAVMLRKTRVGLNLRAVGENPATADAAGLNVTAYKYAFILIGSAIAGLGGLCYVMEYMGGIPGAGVSDTVEGFGWLAIALVIFTLWKPDFAILGSIIFGGLYILNTQPGISIPIDILKLIPYAVTVIVLIITSIIGKKETQPPASLGLSYFREER